MEFEWHDFKAEANWKLHGVAFELAKTVFADPFAIEFLDDREDYGEARFVIIGMAEGRFFCLWLMPNARRGFASFPPGGQRNVNKTITSAKMASVKMPDSKMLRAMTPEAVEKAADADHDAHPLTQTDLKRMRRTPQAKIIRRALELTQEEFSARYHIPLGTLRDWEQGRAEPDQPTRAYLRVIASDPERVSRVLNPSSQ